MRRLDHIILPEEAGRQVGMLLRYRMGLSGTVLRRIKWLEDGILLDGVRVTTRQTVRAGQLLSARLTDSVPQDIAPTPGPLDIVYQDEDMLVLNKQPGVTVHPGPGHYFDTLGNFLMDYYKNRGSDAGFHPIHRLDKGTSGLMVVALHAFGQEVLKNQLHTGSFRRIYLAVCDGAPPQTAGTIDAPIGRQDGSILTYAVRPDGVRAVTHYRVLTQTPHRSLVRLELETGRTHQIRVHMAHLGCPLTGDFLYGAEDRALISRPALHSHELTVRQPVTRKELHFTVPLPQDMSDLLKPDFV